MDDVIDRFVFYYKKKKKNSPEIPIAPFPGHWQSRLGPHPLHSEPWTNVSSLSSDRDCLDGGLGYWLLALFTRSFDSSSFCAYNNQENNYQYIKRQNLTVRASIW